MVPGFSVARQEPGVPLLPAPEQIANPLSKGRPFCVMIRDVPHISAQIRTIIPHPFNLLSPTYTNPLSTYLPRVPILIHPGKSLLASYFSNGICHDLLQFDLWSKHNGRRKCRKNQDHPRNGATGGCSCIYSDMNKSKRSDDSSHLGRPNAFIAGLCTCIFDQFMSPQTVSASQIMQLKL